MVRTRKHIPTPTKEVTFKITGSGKTAAGIKNGIDYITRNGELEAYCYDGKGSEQTGKGEDFNREFTSTLSKGNDYSGHIVEKTSIM